jgi:hypothetical protein
MKIELIVSEEQCIVLDQPRHLHLVHAHSYPTDLSNSINRRLEIKNKAAFDTCNQVHGNEDSAKSRQLRKHIVDLIVCIRHFNGNLRQVVGVRARKDFFIMVEVLGHSNKMVLYSPH